MAPPPPASQNGALPDRVNKQAPALPGLLVATPLLGGKVLLQFRAPGNDGLLGRASGHEVRLLPGHFPAPPSCTSGTTIEHGGASLPPAGQREQLTAGPLASGPHTLLLRARDDAGNGSAVATAQITMP